MVTDLAARAERTLDLMRRRGFDGAQVSISETERSEVNVAHNEASLLRTGVQQRVDVIGLLDGRRAASDGNDLGDEGLAQLVDDLWQSVRGAPQDEANAVSSGQRLRLQQGPMQADVTAVARSMSELLAWRARETPTMMIEEAAAAHNHVRLHTLTSGGSDVACDLGYLEMMVFGLAREGTHASSFNYAGGSADSLADPLSRFGLARMMRDLTRQVLTQPLGARFVGEVILSPAATADLVGWLLGQISDGALIDGSSLYRRRVGERVASPMLTLASRFDGPGCVPLSGDAFVTPPVTVLDAGRLTTLTPSLYGSRKTGEPHVPTAGHGWSLAAGDSPLDAMVAAVPRGALVDRLSMGEPAANGDFSGVIKNSFAIVGGRVGPALAETMISGNVAQMLKDVIAVSRQRIDTGGWVFPWLRIGGLHFS